MAVISDKIIELLNFRIQKEEYSSRLYQAISVCMEYKGYTGAAKLFNKYSQEELSHAKWAYDYLLSLDIRPTVPALDAPPEEFEGLVQVLELAYQHEIEVTEECKQLAITAQKENDYMTLALAQKYLTEQIDEISKTVNWLDRVEVLGGSEINFNGLYLLDRELETLA